MAKTNNYDASSITVLEGLEAVRKRPGMYIGSVSTKGLNHLIYEIVDNAVDEHLAGYCTQLGITLTRDGGVVIEDNGRGVNRLRLKLNCLKNGIIRIKGYLGSGIAFIAFSNDRKQSIFQLDNRFSSIFIFIAVNFSVFFHGNRVFSKARSRRTRCRPLRERGLLLYTFRLCNPSEVCSNIPQALMSQDHGIIRYVRPWLPESC